MPTPIPVDFAGSVLSLLPDNLCDQLKRDLAVVFTPTSRNEQRPNRVFVSHWFQGYTPKPDEKIVLGVEVRYADRYETSIVKVGIRKEVAVDNEGWQVCTRDRNVSSRIFSPVKLVSGLTQDRVAVLYRDAYTLFGMDPKKSQPASLETVTGWSVCDDQPDPLSVERAIANVYTDLGRWFFPGAEPNRDLAATFYRDKLFPKDKLQPLITKLWQETPERKSLRRDAVWLLCGRDKPDEDPVTNPARYLDPLDFVVWSLDSDISNRLPDTLVGRAHGDLHGRNILLSVRRGEAEYPAVFDYGAMSDKNVLAWDFAKLEMELKIRLLPDLCHQDEVVCDRLLKASTIKAVEPSAEAHACPTHTVHRARRLAAFLAFEELMHDRTLRIDSRVAAEALQPFCVKNRTGIQKLDRLIAVLLRIRREAALWLGFERHQRNKLWLDEYYFALAVYGLLNVRWDYEVPQTECALVAAGVAAARMPSTPKTIAAQIGKPSSPPSKYVSYRVPLAIAHGHWKAKKYAEAQGFLEETILQVEFEPTHGAEGSAVPKRKNIRIRPEFEHAIPLIAESALIEIECGEARLAEPLLESLRPVAKELGDFETLGRIGRLFKESGDRHWQDAGTKFEGLPGTAACQMYINALTVYEEAFLGTDDYYTGINAATLALLTGDAKKAIDYATKVADLCERLKNISRHDRFWVYATEGEAALLRGNLEKAREFYHNAIAELSPGQGGMADSAYKQLCRLWKALGEKVVPLLDLFELSSFGAELTQGLLGRVPAKQPT